MQAKAATGAAEETKSACSSSADVVIIGAGMAGLTAAAAILRNSGEDCSVLLLEATNRVGGRAYTHVVGGQKTDLGAAWIHGLEGNPLPIKPSSLVTFCDFNPWMYTLPSTLLRLWEATIPEEGSDSGAFVTSNVTEDYVTWWKTAFKEAQELLWRRGAACSDATTSVETACKEVTAEVLEALKPEELEKDTCKRLLEWGWGQAEMWMGASLSDLQLSEFCGDGGWGDYPGPHCVPKHGIQELVNACFDPIREDQRLRVRFGNIVTEIQYTDHGATLNVLRKEGSAQISCKRVIVTVPLGVLKYSLEASYRGEVNGRCLPYIDSSSDQTTVDTSAMEAWDGKLSFKPPLPPWKVECIEHLDVGDYTKFILVFKDMSFLPKDAPATLSFTNIHAPGYGDGSSEVNRYLYKEKGIWVPYFLNYYPVKGTPVLMGVIVGNHSKACHKLSYEQCKEAAMECLRGIAPSAPAPQEFCLTRWESFKGTRGAYTYAPLGCFFSETELLRVPVSASTPDTLKGIRGDGSEEDMTVAATFREGIVHFAGEACNAEFMGSLQAAYLSGMEVGEDVAKSLKAAQRRAQDLNALGL